MLTCLPELCHHCQSWALSRRTAPLREGSKRLLPEPLSAPKNWRRKLSAAASADVCLSRHLTSSSGSCPCSFLVLSCLLCSIPCLAFFPSFDSFFPSCFLSVSFNNFADLSYGARTEGGPGRMCLHCAVPPACLAADQASHGSLDLQCLSPSRLERSSLRFASEGSSRILCWGGGSLKEAKTSLTHTKMTSEMHDYVFEALSASQVQGSILVSRFLLSACSFLSFREY